MVAKDTKGKIFYILSVGFVSGIAVRSFFYVPSSFILCVALISLVLGLYVLYFKQVGGERTTFYIPLFIFALAIGLLRFDATEWDQKSLLDNLIDTKVVLEGKVVREPMLGEKSVSFVIHDELREAKVLVRTDRHSNIMYGDVLRVEGVLKKPQSFETDFGRTFDYGGYLSARDIYYTMSFADVSVLERGQGNIFFSHLFALKRGFMENIEALLPEPEAGLGEGITLGVKRALGSDLETAFRTTGIIHIVVLSGYNVAIVAEAIMRLLSYFFRPRIRLVVGIIAIIIFALLVGLSATVVRASIMALLVLVARFTKNTYAVMRALVLSGLMMLVINPKLLIFDPGFQLSFLATFGLIVLAPFIEEKLSLMPTRFQIREFITATLATQIFVLPLLLYSIGELSLVAVPVNVLVLIVVPLAMLLVFLTGMVGFISLTLALPFAYGAHLLLTYIVKIVEVFAALPFSSVIVPSFSFVWVVLAYSLLIFLISKQTKNPGAKPEPSVV